jgi:DNA-binding response OmpR family regulator
LEQAGYTVTVAEDGDTALSQIRSLHPDLVLLELLLPGLDGFTVLKTMKAEQASADIPVIILTSLTQESDKNEAINSGAVSVMLKDEVSIRDVLLAVQHQLAA